SRRSPMPDSRSSSPPPIPRAAARCARWPNRSWSCCRPRRPPPAPGARSPSRASMLLPLAVLLVMQGAGASPPTAHRVERADLRAGLDTLYAGAFPVAAQYFMELSARDSADPAPVIFHAGALIWWAAAQDSDDFASAAIDSLLGRAITMARASPPGADHDFW